MSDELNKSACGYGEVEAKGRAADQYCTKTKGHEGHCNIIYKYSQNKYRGMSACHPADVRLKNKAKQEEDNEFGRGLSKSEITAKLFKKASIPTLAKSERELINNYYAGTVDLTDIAHLLD